MSVPANQFAEIGEDLNRIAEKIRGLFPTIELGHDDRVTVREVHDGATRFAQQLEELSRRL